MSARLLVVLTLGLLVTPLAAQHWPSFRGPGASGTADARPPLAWDVAAGRGVAWKVSLPGFAHSSPIVWGDRIFVTTAVSELETPEFKPGYSNSGQPARETVPHAWRLMAIDRRSGRLLWDRTAHEGVPKTLRHVKSSQASSTPATDGRVVVAFFGSEGLHAFDLDGRFLWKQDLGVLDAGSIHYPERQWGTASSPVVDDGRVFVQCDLQRGSFVAAFDLATGRRLWTTTRDEIPSWATPTIAGTAADRVVVTNGGRFIRAYDVATGQERWRLAHGSDIAVPTPVTEDALGLTVVMSGYQPAKPIFAIRHSARGDITPSEGGTHSKHLAWRLPRGGAYIPTPILYGGRLYVLSSQGVLTAYDAQTGRSIYERRVADRGGAYSASPVAAEGRLYITSEDGDIHVIRAGDTYELLQSNTVGEALMATPAIVDRMLIVRGVRHLFAFTDEAGAR